MVLIRIILFTVEAVKLFLHKNCQYMAAAISFYALFSMFPLGLAVISIIGFLIGTDPESTELAQEIADVLPVSNELVGSTMEGIVSARAITGIASFIGLIWASSAAFSALRKGINAAWGVTMPRPFLRERLIDIGLVFCAGMLILLILFTTPIIGVVREVVENISPEGQIPADNVWDIISRLVSPLLIFGSILLLYRWMPNTKIVINYVIPGALVVSIFFIAAQYVFIWYVKTFPVYNIVYGSVGALMALLAWVYFSSLILLFGAQATSMFHEYGISQTRPKGFKNFWTGLSKARIRIVETNIGH
tara:strand:- start:105 stop:1019 length:915 start_codon:yes stop_codon:yes gene_type:complete